MTRDYSARLKNRAQYTPAVQSGSHYMPYRDPSTIRGGNLPSYIGTPKALDWLDPSNRFFSSDRALFSAGQFIGGNVRSGMCSNRPGTTILCDSGGLQYGLGRDPWRGNASRAWTLNFLETNADEAISLDIPTVAISRGPAVFNSFAACLQTTLANNAFFHQHRTTDLRVLSVLQGTTSAEAVTWYDAVKVQPFEGWAFAGALRRDYRHMAGMVVRLLTDGLLGASRNRIHVLGVSKLTDAVMLSAFQRALREHLSDDALQITYDTSSPWKMAMSGQAYGYGRFNAAQFDIASFAPPSGHVHAGSGYRFPVASSRLGEQLIVGDLCVAASTRQHGWDTFGNELIVNHNIESMFRAIEDANSIVELPTAFAASLAPPHVIRSYNAIRTMFQFPNALTHLARFKSDLALL